MAKDQSEEWGEKVGLQGLPATNLYFQYFLSGDPLKTTKKYQNWPKKAIFEQFWVPK